MGEGIIALLAFTAALVGIIYFWDVIFPYLTSFLPKKPSAEERTMHLKNRLQRGELDDDRSFEDRLRDDIDKQLRP